MVETFRVIVIFKIQLLTHFLSFIAYESIVVMTKRQQQHAVEHAYMGDEEEKRVVLTQHGQVTVVIYFWPRGIILRLTLIYRGCNSRTLHTVKVQHTHASKKLNYSSILTTRCSILN